MIMLADELIEREYNLRAAFPDHPQWFARWAAESAETRSRYSCIRDVRYGSGPKQTLDIFPAAQSRSALMFIHGGYWRALDKQDHSFVAAPFVERGIGVAVINYDLCPDVSVADITEQCREALLWLKREGARFGVPSERLVVAGHSAGGHLAAMLFATDWSQHRVAEPVAGGVAISGVFDLSPLVRVSFNSDLRLDVNQTLALSPIHMAPRVQAPMQLAVGGNETSEFIRQSWLLWERWAQCRPPRSAGPLIIARKHHFAILSELGHSGTELTRQVLQLFDVSAV